MPTKLIEVALPLDVINREAAREKSIRHGHPSTLHLWWARRPLAACRAVLFAQLVDDPSAHPDRFPTEDAQDVERQRLFRIIERLVPWEASNNAEILEEARAEIRKCYPDGLPTIVDPFCGGGSIPLEAQRLGLEAHASDLNPVAVLITKALIELPPKFADRPPVHPQEHGKLAGTQTWKGAAGLAEDVRWYGNWMREQAEKRLGHLYPKATLPDGSKATVIAWIWARTVTCPNPACGATMPLIRSFWLGKKKGKETWVRPVPDQAEKRVRFEIDRTPAPLPIDHSTRVRPPCGCWICTGTVSRTGALCLVCGSPASLSHIKSEGQSGDLSAQLMATVAEGHRQRVYLAPTSSHEAAANIPEPESIPDTALATHPQYMGTPRYGLTQHSDLFTPRQLTALSQLCDLVREVYDLVLSADNSSEGYAAAIATYLSFVVSRLSDYSSSTTTWASNPQMEILRSTFARQAIPMTWDFAEGNLFASSSGSMSMMTESVARALSRAPAVGRSVVTQHDARTRSYRDLVIATDPPYYDNVPYADLSDYFYVWLRLCLSGIAPELLDTMLTPKQEELVADQERFGGKAAAADHFERGFRAVFGRAVPEMRNDVPMTLFYAFKQTEPDDQSFVASTGWEKLLEGLLISGLSVTATWPVRSERAGRMREVGANALASSIVLSCRRRLADGVTDHRGFQQALKPRLSRDLRTLQSGGIAPVDLAQAAIGPGMAVFSSYAKVIEPNGNPMSVRTALQLINQVLDEVTAEQEGEFDEDTRWAIAWYSEFGMDDGPYGRADDLSRAKNVSVEGLVRAGIVKSGAGKVRLLDRSELDANWDPTTDTRLTVWEVTQHLIRRLLDDSEASAGDLLSRVGGLGEAARDLAYRLFQIAESKRWSKEAGPYNALAAAWPELTKLAAAGPDGQQTLI